MSTRLKRKNALVTGATSNIGRAIAIAFAAEGTHVIASGRNPRRGAEVVEQIHAAGGHAGFIAAYLDGSAGVPGPRCGCLRDARRTDRRARQQRGDLSELDHADRRRSDVRRDLRDQRQGAVLPHRCDRARNERPRIGVDHQPRLLGGPAGNPDYALYASTKGAMETLTRAWAAEFGSPGVRVNAISPGVVRTPIENDPAAATMNGTPYGAFGTPEAIAHAAVYLASDESQFVNGTVIDVDGGRVGVA